MRKALSIVSAILVTSCGGNSGKKSSSGGTVAQPIERAFQETSRENRIPIDILKAVGWLESQLSPWSASSVYRNPKTGVVDKKMGLSIGQTAFGISASVLDLEPGSSNLEEQIRAYGSWVGSQLGALSERLSMRPKNDEEVLLWLRQLSTIHRPGNGKNNERVLFILEMEQLLNRGFEWQGTAQGERISLLPRGTSLDFAKNLPPVDASSLRLNLRAQEIPSAKFMPVQRRMNRLDNTGKRILVTHCPFSLSTCMELQSRSADEEIKLEAHILIPSDRQTRLPAIQVAGLNQVLQMTDRLGNVTTLDDTIVVQLTGYSGRIVEGKRFGARPDWFTSSQLALLGGVVYEVCTLMDDRNSLELAKCMSPSDGTSFYQPVSTDYLRWGEIPDFDEKIFNGYIESRGVLPGVTQFEFTNPDRTFGKGDLVPFNLLFQLDVQSIELEKLVRCPDDRLVWSSIAKEEVRLIDFFTFEKRFFDAGPNNDGTQFVRAKVYQRFSDYRLLGWDVARFWLTGVEGSPQESMPEDCVL